MASPVRFPRGLSTFQPRSLLGSYPIATSPTQISLAEDFIPYRAGDYTVTQTNGTAATFSYPSGALKLSTSGATAADLVFLQRLGAGFQAILGNQFWGNFRFAYPRSVGNTNDTNIYLGWFDTVNPSAATNGIYFLKPAGGTAVHFVIKKAGVTTTFQNIADMALPSGLFGDTNAVNGTINATVAGNAVTATSIATAGAGYQIAPLVLSTAASGAAGLVPLYAQIGATAFSSTNPSVPIQTTALPYGSLASPVVTNPAAGAFTNAASTPTYLEVEPVLDLGFYFDGIGVLFVGVNGRQVMSIRGKVNETGVVGIAAGATVNVATQISSSFYSTTQLTPSISPVQPALGSPINLLPLVPLNIAAGFGNTTANARAFYLLEYVAAVELL